jgi:hypothetical protein
MSEGEVEVSSGSYEVLPKEVLAEVGSVKLFSTSDPHILQFDPKSMHRSAMVIAVLGIRC